VQSSLARSRGREPLHSFIRRELQRAIASGEFAVDDWLPSEAELQVRFGVSQTPVRRALRDLEQMGLIDRLQGRGSVVRSSEFVALAPMTGFGAELRSRGYRVDAKLLAVNRVECPEVVAQELECQPGAAVLKIERMYLLDGIPSVLFEHHLSPTVTEQLDPSYFETGVPSLYGLLAEIGIEPEWAFERITAGCLDAQQAELLSTDEGTPVLLQFRNSYLMGDVPLEYTQYLIRADRYELRLKLRSSWP
jgi:GntR family transcriptional regulator